MASVSYQKRMSAIETYFDRTAVEAWARLTSDAPLGRIRETVRAGRHQMRETLLDWLPQDLRGRCLLDAGCGTGALAVAAARRGATVVAIDLSATLIALARERAPQELSEGRVEFVCGDMLDPALGRFDHVVGMDCLIHYPKHDIIESLAELAGRANRSILFTFAPRTPALALMHAVGRLFPRDDRAPAILPVSTKVMRRAIISNPRLAAWRAIRSQRIANGFYTSEALELGRI
jgi:magnesium-protoporphyrin O-methyltransferase